MTVYDTDLLTGETFTYTIPGGLGSWDPKIESLAQEAARRGEVITTESMARFAEEVRQQEDERSRRIAEDTANLAPVERRHLAKADGFLADNLVCAEHRWIRDHLRRPLAQWFAEIERNALGGRAIR